jgi:hypothetical protein
MTLLTWTARPLTHAGPRRPGTGCNDRGMLRKAQTYPGGTILASPARSADNSQYG